MVTAFPPSLVLKILMLSTLLLPWYLGIFKHTYPSKMLKLSPLDSQHANEFEIQHIGQHLASTKMLKSHLRLVKMLIHIARGTIVNGAEDYSPQAIFQRLDLQIFIHRASNFRSIYVLRSFSATDA